MTDRIAQLLSLPESQRAAAMRALSPQALRAVKEQASRKDMERWQTDPAGYISDQLGETLWSKQRDICSAIRDHERVAVPACHAPGKAVRDGTPVLTPDGWRAIETLAPGDFVIAGDGTPTRVRGVYPQGRRQLYRLTFTDGFSVDADGDHLWSIRHGRRRSGRDLQVLTTKQILDRWGPKPIGHDRVELPSVEPVQFPSRPVPLDPYLVGALLGDGCLTKSTPRFTTADEEMLELIGHPHARPTKSRPLDYPLLGILPACRAAGITGRRSWEKSIPDEYLWNDVDVRLAVLRGLMDTDGSVTESKGDVEFSSSSEKLADGVEFLVRSLGGQVRRTVRPTAGRLSHRLRVMMPVILNPFRLSRKAEAWERLAARRKTTTARLLKSIELVDTDYATCIEVDHPSRLFVIDGFVVTHNTHLAARIALWWGSIWPVGTAQVITTATNFRTVRNQLWPYIRRVHKKAFIPGRCNLTEWWVGAELVGYGFSAADTDPEAIQGIHVPHLLVIVDEAGGISHQLGGAFNALVTNRFARLLLLGNPSTDEEGTWFQRCCESPDFETIRLDAASTPNFTGEDAGPCQSCADAKTRPHPVRDHLLEAGWVDKAIRDYGVDSPYVEAKVFARFPDVVTDRVIPTGWAEAAMKNESAPSGDWVRLGVDVASDGGDELVIARAVGNKVTIEHTSAGAVNANSVDVAGTVLTEIRAAQALQTALNPNRKVSVKVDALGVGWGVAGTLERWGEEGTHDAEIKAVKVSERAQDPEEFLNQRAEMWWQVRTHLQPPEDATVGDLHLAVDEVTVSQLSGPKYKNNTKGQKQIESKLAMKARGLRSPDRAEAVCLCLYEPPRLKKKARLLV